MLMSPAFSLLGSYSSPHPNGICSPPSWRLTAFSSPSIFMSCCHPPVFREGSWAVAGISSKLPSCLCYGSALLTRPPWSWVFLGDCCRSGRQLLGLAHISQLETGRILSLLLEFGLELEATCYMSLPIYPQFPPGSQPWPTRFYLSLSPGLARVPPQTGVIS